MEYVAIVKMIGPGLFEGGAAWGGIRAGLNGQKKALDKVSTDLAIHVTAYNTDSRAIVKTLSSLETKVDLLIDKKIKD